MSTSKLEIQLTLASKLASIVVYADEALSDDGHSFDFVAMRQAIADPEVQAWIKALGPLAPVKRVSRCP